MKKLSKVYKELSQCDLALAYSSFKNRPNPKKGPFQYPIESLSRPRPDPKDFSVSTVLSRPRDYASIQQSQSIWQSEEIPF